jgi:Outer membrane lipoprotein-sorting protein
MNFYQLFSATEWRTKIAHGETVGFNFKMDKAPDGAKEMIRGLIFFRPIRGLFRFVFLPTVSPWATFFRASGALAAVILFFAVGARAETTNGLSDAEIQGRQLAQKLLAQQPSENFTNTGQLLIRGKNVPSVGLRFQFQAIVNASNWQTIYETTSESYQVKFLVVHDIGSIQYFEMRGDENVKCEPTAHFAGSDFWLCDLGLEFFRWPQQKIMKKEFTRQCACIVLESTIPDPSTNGYSRVDSWIDEKSGGIVQAFAYDAQGKLLKEFYPTSLKKVDGQYQVQEMEMLNDQTKSRTRLIFDLKK